MKSLCLGIVLLSGSLALAQELNLEDYKAFLKNEDKATSTKMAIKTGCTKSTGESYSAGEKGYNDCLVEIKNKYEANQLSGGKDSQMPGSVPSATTTIQFGN